MTYRNRYLIGAVILLASIGWISLRLWFPAPKEPGYQFINTWGSPGNTPGEFHEPIGIAVVHDKVFVSDAGNNRIQVFDKNGGFLRQFGRGGSGVGELDRPMHIVVHNEKLYVAEYLNDRVQIFIFCRARILSSTSAIFSSVCFLTSGHVVSGSTRSERSPEISLSLNPSSLARLMNRMRATTSSGYCL